MITGRDLESVGTGAASGTVEVPMNRMEAPGERLIIVLESVIAEPGMRVWVPMTEADAALAVMVWEPRVRTGRGLDVAGEGNGKCTVDEPIMMAAALLARLIGVLETVIADPGIRVCDPKT